MAFEDFGQRAPLSGGVVQEYYRKLFEEVGNMKRSKQREEKESAARTVSMGWAGWFRTLGIKFYENRAQSELLEECKIIYSFFSGVAYMVQKYQ